jgi:hypothetical protein
MADLWCWCLPDTPVPRYVTASLTSSAVSTVCVLQQFLVITTFNVLTFESLLTITTHSQSLLLSMKCWLIFRKMLCSVPLLFFVFVVTIRKNIFWSLMGLLDVFSRNFLSTSVRKFCKDVSTGVSYCALNRMLVVSSIFLHTSIHCSVNRAVNNFRTALGTVTCPSVLLEMR